MLFGLFFGCLAFAFVVLLGLIPESNLPKQEDPTAKIIQPIDGVHCLVLQTKKTLATSCWYALPGVSVEPKTQKGA